MPGVGFVVIHRSVSVDADGTVNVDDASIPGLRYEVIEGR